MLPPLPPVLRAPVLGIHIAAGAVALLAGVGALASRKGGRLHRLAGQLYVAAMGVACVTALALVGFFGSGAFLGPIAVLSFYSAFSGWRVVRRRPPGGSQGVGPAPDRLDRAAAGLTVLAGVALLGQAVRQGGETFLLVLGGAAVFVGWGGLRGGPLDAAGRRLRHLRSMLAAYIATMTAFSAVNLLFLPMTMRWLWPTALGTLAIVLWSRAERQRAARLAAAVRRAPMLLLAAGSLLLGCAGDSSRERLAQLPRPAGWELQDRYVLPGPRLFPESVAFDPKRQSFFVSSMTGGNVTRVQSDGATAVFFAGTGEANRLTLGVKVDAARDRLVVCTLLRSRVPTGRIWVFDLASGQRTHDIDLTRASPGGSCNDLTVHPGGDIYVTDREQPNIYRLRNLQPDGGHELTLFVSHPLLARPAVGVGQNGAAITPDGRTLLTTQYLPARLWRIPLDRPDQVTRVALSFPSFPLLAGADGLAFAGEDLLVTFGRSLLRLRSPDGKWQSARLQRLEVGTPLSSVTVALGQVYVLKSDVARFLLGGTPPLPFEIVRVGPARLPP